MTPAEKRSAEAQGAVDRFNSDHLVGSPVRYWTMLRRGEGKTSTTRSKAENLHGTAVVWVEGHSGCISLTHIEVLDTRKP